MTSDELKKLLDEYRIKKIQTYVAKDVYSEGFQDCEKLLWPLVEALEFYGDRWTYYKRLKDGSRIKDLEKFETIDIDYEKIIEDWNGETLSYNFTSPGKRARQALTDLEQKLKGG